MIEEFYNETFTQTRRSTSNPTASDSVATVTSFPGLFRPITEKSQLFVESNFGKEAAVVCDELQSISIGDTLTGSLNGKMEVIGVSKYIDLEDNVDSHLDIRVVKK